METVADATIPTLKKCWERSYMSNPLPNDTLLVAGLNDIRKLVSSPNGPAGELKAVAESVSEDIMHRIRTLYSLNLEHSAKYNVKDTVAVPPSNSTCRSVHSAKANLSCAEVTEQLFCYI